MLFTTLKQRGYTFSKLRQMQKDIWLNYAPINDRNQKIEKAQDKDSRLIPIIINYSSLGTKIGQKIKHLISNEVLYFLTNFCQKIKHLISNEEEFKNDKVLVAYKQSTNIRQMLVRSALESDIVYSFKGCHNAQCLMCKYHTVESNNFRSAHNKHQFSLSHDITCKTENVVYLITCNICNIQYVGETGQRLNDRLNQHKSSISKDENNPISIHFISPNHSLFNLKIMGI